MMTVRTWSFVVLISALWTLLAMAQRPAFHTPPDRWEKPRIYHPSMDSKDRDIAEKIDITRVEPTAIPAAEKHLSPNEAYWFTELGVDTSSGTSKGSVLIDQERDYYLKITFDVYRNYGIRTRWINEKLLFLRIWGGRLAGTDLIVDVEDERILHAEWFEDGSLAFQQFSSLRDE